MVDHFINPPKTAASVQLHSTLLYLLLLLMCACTLNMKQIHFGNIRNITVCTLMWNQFFKSKIFFDAHLILFSFDSSFFFLFWWPNIDREYEYVYVYILIWYGLYTFFERMKEICAIHFIVSYIRDLISDSGMHFRWLKHLHIHCICFSIFIKARRKTWKSNPIIAYHF